MLIVESSAVSRLPSKLTAVFGPLEQHTSLVRGSSFGKAEDSRSRSKVFTLLPFLISDKYNLFVYPVLECRKGFAFKYEAYLNAFDLFFLDGARWQMVRMIPKNFNCIETVQLTVVCHSAFTWWCKMQYRTTKRCNTAPVPATIASICFFMVVCNPKLLNRENLILAREFLKIVVHYCPIDCNLRLTITIENSCPVPP